VETAFGLVGIILWIVFVIVLAAAITWLVVKLFPADRDEKAPTPDSAGNL
jgi:hypothetical protein